MRRGTLVTLVLIGVAFVVLSASRTGRRHFDEIWSYYGDEGEFAVPAPPEPLPEPVWRKEEEEDMTGLPDYFDEEEHQGHIPSSPGRVDSSRGIQATEIVLHASGNTIFDRLYVFDGAIHIVTDEPWAIPLLERITSNGELLAQDTVPTEEDIRVVGVAEAESLFGGRAVRWDGTTFMITENKEFIAHYYHFTAEILLSLIRTSSALNTTLPTPRRLFFPHCTSSDWLDGPRTNPFIVRAAFHPSPELLFTQDWRDLHDTERAFVLERVVLFDRAAASRGQNNAREWKPIAEALSLPTVIHDWWAPVRERVLDFVGGDLPRGSDSPRVVYVSRQTADRRRLREEDHVALVQHLEEASREMGFELEVVQLERMSKPEQIRLMARTTVLMGLHGNGLTSMMWLRQTPRTAVFEFFFPGMFLRDYEYTAKSLGFTYRGFWNDTTFVHPGFNAFATDDLNSVDIPINAATVVGALQDVLAQTPSWTNYGPPTHENY